MANKNNINRRQFMGGVAGAAAAFTIVPRHVLGGAGYTPPSEKLNIAGVGIGGMGKNNLKKCEGENIVALCDVDEEYAGKIFDLYPGAKKYTDYRKMLKKQKDIEAVIIATPDHTHAVIAMTAMKMGKHVYVQKPMTRTVYEARKLTEAARKYKVATQMGNQGHSDDGMRMVTEWLDDGAIGPVREVHCWTNRPLWPQGIGRPKDTPPVPPTLDWELWIGPMPERPYHPAYAPWVWRGWWDFGCGALGDMGCHIMDIPFYALKLKYPSSVEASCPTVYLEKGKVKETAAETAPVASIVRYKFPARGKMPAVNLTWYDGCLMPPRPEELEEGRRLPKSGTIFIGDKGKLMCETYGGSPRLIPETKMQAYKRPPERIPRIDVSHEEDWVRACKGGKAACSNFEYAGPLTETVVMGNLAIRAGEKLYWDGPNMTVTNVPAANEYVRPGYRQGWSL